MIEFFNALSELLKSDLVKEYGWTIFVCFIICICIVGFIIWVIFMKIILPAKLIENDCIKPKYKNALAELETLKKENTELKVKLQTFHNQERMLKAIETETSEIYTDRALDKFLKK